MRRYTGVGSRSLPLPVCQDIVKIAERLAKSDIVLRSGRAPKKMADRRNDNLGSADQAFERGCDLGLGHKEIYLPASSFPGYYEYGEPRAGGFILSGPSPEAMVIAEKVIGSRWNYLNHFVRLLHARNVHQVLGEELDSPSDILICGSVPDRNGVPEGGTATAWKVAIANGVTCYNLLIAEHHEKLHKALFS